MHAHAVFCEQLLKDFCSEISGENVDILYDKHPQDRFLVGMLSPRREESPKNGSSVLVNQIGLDILLREEDIQLASVDVSLHGNLFYRARPTLEQQRDAFLRALQLKGVGKSVSCKSFDELLEHIDVEVQNCREKPMAVYKKLSIADIITEPLTIHLKDIYSLSTHSGIMDRTHPANILIDNALNNIAHKLSLAEDRYVKNNERVTIEDLRSEEAWAAYEARVCADKPSMRQNWFFLLSCDMQLINNGLVRVAIKLNNDSPPQPDQASGNHSNRDKERVPDLYNAGISVDVKGCDVQPVLMDYFRDSYKYDRYQYAVGSNCSVTDTDHKHFETTLLPIYRQNRLKTDASVSIGFADLDADCIKTLERCHQKMIAAHQKWITDYTTKEGLSPKAKKEFWNEIEAFGAEIARFKYGVDIIRDYQIVRDAFVRMNRTFMAAAQAKGYSSWRLFQIVFIVSLIPDIIACDPEIMDEDEKRRTHLHDVDLLYFPTGGGKTEAFLGVLIFNLFFDRARGKSHGVTAILKYPLRLLSVQQVQRVADILAQAERIRLTMPEQANASPFTVGYYVGDGNTPNKIEDKTHKRLCSMSQQELDEEYRVVDRCPFCRNTSVHVIYNRDARKLIHHCATDSCDSGGDLPVYITDSDVYHYLPSVVISTIDKMAAIGYQRRFKNIFGSVKRRCPVHGYHELKHCDEKECLCDQEIVRLYDPAPSLYIQDELHLVRESLGTYASHYEALIQYFGEFYSDSQRKAKIIGATATISHYQAQVQQLYLKDAILFPCPSPDLKKNFYSFIDDNDLHRLVLGYTPFGRAIINSVVYSMMYMRICLERYRLDPEKVLQIPEIGITSVAEAKKVIDDYWIMLEYNNVKVDGNNVLNALEDPVNTELANMGYKAFDARKMTGDDTFQDVRKTLSEVENTRDVSNGFNLIVATSMISHGVDADRFNNMFFFGIPGSTAEYIQAYSRVGRKYAGIVIDIIRPTRERELSYQKFFIKSHEYKDILVDPVPINRWASRAVLQTLPGIFVSLVLNHYMYQYEHEIPLMYMMAGLKTAINKGYICREVVTNEICKIYGCGEVGCESGRGLQYRKLIHQHIDDLFDKIDNTEFDNNVYISTGLESLGYRVMTTLRDTDVGLNIELR